VGYIRGAATAARMVGMSQPFESQPSESQPQDEIPGIAHDLLCMRCGYNLRTLAIGGRCPSCGYPVGHSLGYERSLPPLAQGCWWLAVGTGVLAGLGALNLFVHLGSNVLYDGLGRVLWVKWYSPVLAAARVADIGMLIFAVVALAKSKLGPAWLRRDSPLGNLLALALAGLIFTTGVLATINLLESPLGVPMTLGILRARYLCFFVQSLCHAPLLLCGWVYFRGLSKRPEFAEFRAWVVVFALMDIFFWVIFGTLELYFLSVLNLGLRRPPESLWSILRVVDWVELVSVVPEVIFWFLLARHAWRLRVREEA